MNALGCKIGIRNKFHKKIWVAIPYLDKTSNGSPRVVYAGSRRKNLMFYTPNVEDGKVYFYAHSRGRITEWCGSNYFSVRGERFGFKEFPLPDSREGGKIYVEIDR